MNFDCVGRDSNGQLYMKRHIPFTIVEKIQGIERWILVKLFAYYRLNYDDNIGDFQYSDNVKQLEEFFKSYSKEFKRSRYYSYFHDFFDSDDPTIEYVLLERVRNADSNLYTRIERDAQLSLEFGKKEA